MKQRFQHGKLAIDEKAVIMNIDRRGSVNYNRWTIRDGRYCNWMKTIFNLTLIFGLGLAACTPWAQAQDEAPPPMPAAQTFNDTQLQQLLGPIALYPDPLIAIMLPAATLVGYGIGYGLDVFFSTHYLKIVFLLIGTVAGFIELIRGLTKE